VNIYYNVRLQRAGATVSVYVWAESDSHAALQARLLLSNVPRWIPSWLTREHWEVYEIEPIGVE